MKRFFSPPHSWYGLSSLFRQELLLLLQTDLPAIPLFFHAWLHWSQPHWSCLQDLNRLPLMLPVQLLPNRLSHPFWRPLHELSKCPHVLSDPAYLRWSVYQNVPALIAPDQGSPDGLSLQESADLCPCQIHPSLQEADLKSVLAHHCFPSHYLCSYRSHQSHRWK